MVKAARPTPAERDKQARAAALLVEGKTYTAIAAELGYADASGARWAVNAYYKRQAQEVMPELRQILLDRCEWLWARAVERIEESRAAGDVDGWNVGMRHGLAAVAQGARVAGVDRPEVRVQVGSEEVATLQRELEALLGSGGGVVEGEVVGELESGGADEESPT